MTAPANHPPSHELGPPGTAAPTLAAATESTVDLVRAATVLRQEMHTRERERLVACAAAMAVAFGAGGRLFAFGNGGSATDAHDLASGFLRARGGTVPLPAYALTHDVATMTTLADNAGFDAVFARQLAMSGRRGDIAVGLSTSGDSENLVQAFAEARRRGLLTVGLAGNAGGRMAEVDSIDHLFLVPSSSAHRIHEAHTTVCNVLAELIRVALRGRQAARRSNWQRP